MNPALQRHRIDADIRPATVSLDELAVVADQARMEACLSILPEDTRAYPATRFQLGLAQLQEDSKVSKDMIN